MVMVSSISSVPCVRALSSSTCFRKSNAVQVRQSPLNKKVSTFQGKSLPLKISHTAHVGGQVNARSTRLCVFAAEAPEDAYSAIVQGQEQYQEKNYEKALALFEKALTLPGSGVKQFTDKPALISDQERATALFNISCCHCQLNDERLALVSMAGAFESGFSQFDLLLTEPDLEMLRGAEKFAGLVGMYNQIVGEKLFAIKNGTEMPEERGGLDAFVHGDWLWKALTKTRAPVTDQEYLDITNKKRDKRQI